MFQLISAHKPKSPAPAPSPFAWENEEQLQEWLGGSFELEIVRGTSMYREPSVADAWEAFATCYGPTKTLIARLNDEQLEAFRRDFIALHQQYETATGMLLPRPYLVVTGTRK